MRIAAALPVLAAIALYAIVSGGWWAASALAVVALTSLFRGPSLTLPPLLGTAIMAGAASLSAIFVPQAWVQTTRPEGLSELSVRTAAGLLLFAGVRLHLVRPPGGADITLALLLGAAVACGQAPGQWQYPVLLGGLLAAMAASVLHRDGGPRFHLIGRRRKQFLLVGLIVGAGVATVSATVLPVLHARAIRMIYDWERGGSTTGISDEILLGGTANINESDELVLRIHGPRPDHLRGVVFNRYLNGRWVPGAADPGKPIVLSTRPPDGATRVEPTKSGPRYFVPLLSHNVASPPGIVVVDRMGTYRAPTGAAAETIWFVAGGTSLQEVAPPSSDDFEVPTRWAPRLRTLAEAWTEGAQNDETRLSAIEHRLQSEFRYSLKHTRKTNADPIVDFLTVHRVGHCEYFASGMALLARSLGIPSRVVSGFRVREYNPVGEFHVVRARDAHAWVEAWVDGRWVTYDPTPPAAFANLDAGTTPWALAVWDWAEARWSEVDGAQVRLTLFGTTALLASGAALVLWIRRRRGERAKSREAERTGPTIASVVDLFAALSALGLERRPSETLEAYGDRLRQEGSPATEAAASILDAYARLAYGGLGRPSEIEAEAVAWLRQGRARRKALRAEGRRRDV